MWLKAEENSKTGKGKNGLSPRALSRSKVLPDLRLWVSENWENKFLLF